MSTPLIPIEHVTEADCAPQFKNLDEVIEFLTEGHINLKPEERQSMGTVDEKGKLLINKTGDYAASTPALRDPKANYGELEKGRLSTRQMEIFREKCRQVGELAGEREIVYDNNNHKICLQDYAYTQFQAERGEGGFEGKYDDMRQFF